MRRPRLVKLNRGDSKAWRESISPSKTEAMGMLRKAVLGRFAAAGILLAAFVASASAQSPWAVVFPEQRHLKIRDPSELPHLGLPDVPPPPTVSAPQFDA